ncbi:hypothetical protein GCM10009641_37460 [Mycobacterium cookii]|uniref:Uncharacterized protein n=1 Tax=Nocardioides furvisabuli TaxID=375542 RepID=A0ABN2X1C1_9ACTN|nr:hypothetical protein [Nocardioides furvisabuli]
MSTPDPLSRRDAERLLDDPAADSSALGAALTAASGPARADELRREDATAAAFHRARLDPAPVAPPARQRSRAATRAVVATGAVVALTTGGLALANSAHLSLPLLPDRASDRASEAVTSAPGGARSTGTAGTTTDPTGSSSGPGGPRGTSGSAPGSATATGGGGASSSAPAETGPTGTTTGTPSPNLSGLCNAYHAADGAGKSLDSAAFRVLAEAAGGAEQVAAFCVALVGEPRGTGKPTDKPSPTGKPTDKPSPTDKPTDKPSPTGKPTDKPSPTDKPTDKPSPTDKPTPTQQPTPGNGQGNGNGNGNGNGGGG